MPAAKSRAEVLLLIVSWLLVAVPLLWGVYQTYQKSLPLFR